MKPPTLRLLNVGPICLLLLAATPVPQSALGQDLPAALAGSGLPTVAPNGPVDLSALLGHLDTARTSAESTAVLVRSDILAGILKPTDAEGARVSYERARTAMNSFIQRLGSTLERNEPVERCQANYEHALKAADEFIIYYHAMDQIGRRLQQLEQQARSGSQPNMPAGGAAPNPAGGGAPVGGGAGVVGAVVTFAPLAGKGLGFVWSEWQKKKAEERASTVRRLEALRWRAYEEIPSAAAPH